MRSLLCALALVSIATSARADEPLCAWAKRSVAELDSRHGSHVSRTLVRDAGAADAAASMNAARTELSRCFAGWTIRDRRGHAALGDAKELAVESKTRGIYLTARGVPDAFTVEVVVR